MGFVKHITNAAKRVKRKMHARMNFETRVIQDTVAMGWGKNADDTVDEALRQSIRRRRARLKQLRAIRKK